MARNYKQLFSPSIEKEEGEAMRKKGEKNGVVDSCEEEFFERWATKYIITF